jgi:predicted PurR-regulated permease PerM
MKILTLICAAFLSLSTLSIPVAQEEIDRLNTIISFTDTPSLKVRLTAAERDESTNRLSSIDTETTLTNEEGLSLNVLLGLEKINQEQVQIRGGLKGQVSRAPLTKTQLYVMLTMISSLTEQLNKSKL